MYRRILASISASIVASTSIHFHDNHLDRGLDLHGCLQCELDHNVVTLALPAAEPVVNLRKLSSNVVFHDEIYTRAASAGPRHHHLRRRQRLRVDGIVANGSSGDGSVRSTDIHVVDTEIDGPARAAMGISGSYSGVGSVELTRVGPNGASQGLGCEGISTGAGITGPVTYVDNQLPPPPCSPLVP